MAATTDRRNNARTHTGGIMRKALALLAVLVAALTGAVGAQATTVDQLPSLGYSVQMNTLVNGCHDWTASGFGASIDFGSDCDPGFSAAVDAFAAGHDERKLAFQHPDAVSHRAGVQAKGYAVATDYSGPSFHVTGDCNVDRTVDVSGLAALDATLPTSAPCPPPAVTTTTTTTEATAPTSTAPATATAPATTTTTSSVDQQIAELQAQIDALKAEYEALKAEVGLIFQANIASWSAYIDALRAGASPVDAALAARSAGMNVMYGLASA